MVRTCSTVLLLACGVALAGTGAPARAADYQVLYAFQGTDGQAPAAGLIAVGGTLYGTTVYGGGVESRGTVFALSLASHIETVVHSFQGGSDGEYPEAGLIEVGGTLYGTTPYGGLYSRGTVFAVDLATGAETVVHSFQGGSDGEYPESGLIDVGGKLYGTTGVGGLGGDGTVFSLDPTTRAEIVLHSFQGGSDGQGPVAALIDVGGTLYGTTEGGGPSGAGTVFSLDLTTGAETVVYSFRGNGGGSILPPAGLHDGSDPGASLVDIGGLFYGTTASGGRSGNCSQGAHGGYSIGCGTVFSLDPSTGVETVVSSFRGDSQAAAPSTSLVRVGGRRLYGATSGNGATGQGTVFRVDPATGAARIVYSFQGGSGGQGPAGGLIDIDGTLYGTTTYGGRVCAPGCGTVFALKP